MELTAAAYSWQVVLLYLPSPVLFPTLFARKYPLFCVRDSTIGRFRKASYCYLPVHFSTNHWIISLFSVLLLTQFPLKIQRISTCSMGALYVYNPFFGIFLLKSRKKTLILLPMKLHADVLSAPTSSKHQPFAWLIGVPLG